MRLTACVVEALISQIFGIPAGEQSVNGHPQRVVIATHSFLIELITARVNGEARSVVYVLILATWPNALRNMDLLGTMNKWLPKTWWISEAWTLGAH